MMVKNSTKYIFILLMFAPVASKAWIVDFNFDKGTVGTQVAEFSDASGDTVYEQNVVHTGKGSAKLTIKEGSDGWGFWGGRKNFPVKLGEGDEVWVKLSMLVPQSFDFTTNTGWLKFLRLNVRGGDGAHIGNHDLLIMPDGSYYHYNELPSVNRLEVFQSEYAAVQNYIVGETITGATSGASGFIRALKPYGFIFEYYANSPVFQQYETIVGKTSGESSVRRRYLGNNSNTFFGAGNEIVRDVWQTFVYRVKFSTTDPLLQFYKHIGESGFTTDGKPIGGSLQLIYEDNTDYTLKNPSDKAVSFLLFTYWNGGAPQTQSLYIDNLQISTTPPAELKVPKAPTNLSVQLK